MKARVHDRADLEQKLEKLGTTFHKPLTQQDEIYVLASDTHAPSEFGRRILRIRQQEGENILTLKIHQSNELESVEKETTFGDIATMRSILELLGFTKTIELVKHRVQGKLGNYELCLDTVEGLGNFIEAEVFSEDEPQKVQAELWQFLQSLGIKEKDQETRGYDTLMRLKNERDT